MYIHVNFLYHISISKDNSSNTNIIAVSLLLLIMCISGSHAKASRSFIGPSYHRSLNGGSTLFLRVPTRVPTFTILEYASPPSHVLHKY